MTTIPSVASAATSSAAATQEAAKKSKLDYDSFLRLLVEQMKNQDPTKPMEETDYIAQLATFSNVEQAISTNTKLDQLLQMQSMAQATGLIGRTVTSLDGAGSGVVEQVRFQNSQVVAILDTGGELLINERVTIGP